jgi:hypothetical protein
MLVIHTKRGDRKRERERERARAREREYKILHGER